MIEIVDVSPPDGLQNERAVVGVEQKIELVERAIAAGLRRIEVTSFVHPARVPQLADAESVVEALPRDGSVTYTALALNERGYDRAVASGITEVNTVVLASDTFSSRNQGMSTQESLTLVERLAARGRTDGVTVTTTVGASFGCPFEGEVPLTAPGTGGPGRHTHWLTTTNPDGSPHVRPLGVISLGGAWYFTSGPGTRKSRNIAHGPRCVISVATHPFDLVMEGEAERVVDTPSCRRSPVPTQPRAGQPAWPATP